MQTRVKEEGADVDGGESASEVGETASTKYKALLIICMQVGIC